MRLTTRGRYAVTALLDLALQDNKKVSLTDIAKRQHLSVAYLEQLFSKLKQKGLVSSVRGAGGGYLLAKNAHDIAIIDIIDAVNESVDTTKCEKKGNCNHGAMCLTHHLWLDLSTHIESFLAGVTLASLIEKNILQNISIHHTSNTHSTSEHTV